MMEIEMDRKWPAVVAVAQASAVGDGPGAKRPIPAGTDLFILWDPEHRCWYTPDRLE